MHIERRCLDCGEETNRSYCPNCQHVRTKFKVSQKEINRLKEEQGYKCGLCRNFQIGRALAVDLDPETKDIRSLLCHRCKLGVGYFNTLESALILVDYMSKEPPSLKMLRKPSKPVDLTPYLRDPNLKSLSSKARKVAEEHGITYDCAMSRIRRAKPLPPIDTLDNLPQDMVV